MGVRAWSGRTESSARAARAQAPPRHAAPVDDPAALNQANQQWIQTHKADGTLEAAYTLLDNASGLIDAGIVNVDSHEGLRELLLSYPGYLQAEFEVHPILDAEVAIRQNLRFWKR